jgi:hypothetical protein
MARRHATTDRKDMLERAVDRYRAAFGPDALPCMAAVTGRAAPAVVALLDYSVATRRPMRHGQIAAALGEHAAPASGCM